MCLQGFYMDLQSWPVGPYMIWYKMMVVSLCQLQYFQVENILFPILQGVQVIIYHCEHSWIYTLCTVHKGA